MSSVQDHVMLREAGSQVGQKEVPELVAKIGDKKYDKG